MGNFSPVDRDEFKKHNQNGGTFCITVRDFQSYLDPSNFTNKANWHTSKVEIPTRSKLCHFVGRYVVRATLFCLKRFRPDHWAGMFIWENFHPGYRDLGRKNRDLGNRASPASHMNTSISITKKRAARRALGNRASPVDKAHMKRP